MIDHWIRLPNGVFGGSRAARPGSRLFYNEKPNATIQRRTDTLSALSEQSTLWHMPRAAVFVEIVASGSITAAAKRLGLSKSVVSAHLKELEEVCGARLLERSTRRQRLTEIGERFLPRARAMTEAWSEGLRDVRAAMGEPVGTLRVTASSVVDAWLVTPAVARMTARYPRLSVRLDLSDSNRDLIEDEFDLAIRVGPLVDSDLRVRRLGVDRDVVVASPELARRLGEIERPEQLSDVPWVVHSQLPTRRRFVGPGDERLELETPGKVVLNSSSSLVYLLSEGVGVGFVPWSLAWGEIEAGRLVRVIPGWHGGEVPIHAVWGSGKFVPPKTRVFLEVLVEVMRGRG
ncbi:MAG: LysR family transcriptional regulator [Myxococcota bacterium]